MKGHKAHYHPNPHAIIRDKTYPSEVAAQRPALMTRVHCQLSWEETRAAEEESIRGDRGLDLYPVNVPREPVQGAITEDRVALFNKALRAGHGFRNEHEE